jgi:GTP-binding protein EngB required for normal cell division
MSAMEIKTDINQELHALDIIDTVAEERGARAISLEVEEARAALAAGQFNVAVVGQFKRGKSTLINALIGRELLPSDVIPITSAITVLQCGSSEHCRIIYHDGREAQVPFNDIRLFASEEGNPGNQKGVRIILIELPASILENGMRLVDTPGVGSVLEPNSETTRTFLPRIDVAIVVLGSDPPITGEELELVKTLSGRAERLCFVMNKADIVSDDNRQRAESFTRKVISQIINIDNGEIIHTSALSSLQNKRDEGVSRLRRLLNEMAAHSGAELARQSAIQASAYLAERLCQQIDLEREGLVQPIEKLDASIAQFNSSMMDIADLMLAAKVRVEQAGSYDWKDWKKTKAEFIDEQSRGILAKVEAQISGKTVSKRSMESMALETAKREAKLCVENWISLSTSRFNEYYDSRLKVATAELNKLTARISAAASEAFGTTITHLDFQRLKIDMSRIPLEFSEPSMALDLSGILIPIINLAAPKKLVSMLTLKRMRSLIGDWLMKNLYHVDERLINWLDSATRALTEAIGKRLDDLEKEIMAALARGRNERDAGEEAISERLVTLERQRLALSGIIKTQSIDNG